MSFIIDVETENVEGFHTVAGGSEYELRILKATSKNSKKGDPMLEVQMDIPADPKSKDVYHYIMFPTSADDEKQKTRKLLNLKEFKAAFGLPASGPISTDDMEGQRGWAILKEEAGDGDNDSRNSVQRFVVGR
jgi:hypothetical protein